MEAIQIQSRTDKLGHLKLDYNLDVSDRNVQIFIIIDEKEIKDNEEKEWLQAISNNPAFDFLSDSAEDIYSMNDGEPINA